jgi:hypothetical protein
LIGSYLTGLVLQVYQITDASGLVIGHHWKNIMIVPAVIALVVAVLFSLIFTDDTKDIVTAEKEVADPRIP